MRGIVRAVVAQPTDPAGRGRVQVTMISPGSGSALWALTCLPPSSASAKYAAGDTVWVAFENDDPALPVVIGRVAKAAQHR